MRGNERGGVLCGVCVGRLGCRQRLGGTAAAQRCEGHSRHFPPSASHFPRLPRPRAHPCLQGRRSTPQAAAGTPSESPSEPISCLRARGGGARQAVLLLLSNIAEALDGPSRRARLGGDAAADHAGREARGPEPGAAVDGPARLQELPRPRRRGRLGRRLARRRRRRVIKFLLD